MAHQVGNAVRTAYDHTLGSSGLGLTGQDSLVSNAWDTYTGKLDDPLKVGWENQAYNQDWDTQGQNYNANTLGNAQGYTAQGYTGQGYDATQGNATMGNYQTGQDFSGIMGQAMDASRQFMDPSSDWAKGQQSILAETTGQQAGQAQAQQSAQLAARGRGGGGLRGILGSQAQATAAQAQRRGATDIATQGAGLGLQALGQAGQMATAQESNMLNQALANQSASNQYGLANMAAINQANQFGASAQNQANQFTAGAQNTAGQFGASAQNQFSLANQAALNQAGQFNAQQNQAANQFNVGNQMNWQSWNASQNFAADQFNASQQNAVNMANTQGQAQAWQGVGQLAKTFFKCLPEGTKIDTPDGRIKIEDIRAGDIVNGYGNKPVTVMQKHEYNENPEIKRFLKIYFDDADTIDCCDMHKIKGIRAKEYSIGHVLNGKEIVNIKWYDGVERSYDLLTDDPGYRISGIPVNSMVEEMMSLIRLIKETI